METKTKVFHSLWVEKKSMTWMRKKLPKREMSKFINACISDGINEKESLTRTEKHYKID